MSPNKQLERTVVRRHVRAACASFHCAHAARWTRGRAAAQLRRYATTAAALVTRLLFACLMFMPQLSRAQGCEWEGLPAPSVDVQVIEVLRSGGYGPQAGRSVVRIDASGQIVWLSRGQCPDRILVGRMTTPTFADLMDQFRRAVDSIRSQPPRPFVSDEDPFTEILREGRMEPLCQSPEDGVDLDIALYHDGSREHYKCVTGALLQFGEHVFRLVPDAICASRQTSACAERLVGQP